MHLRFWQAQLIVIVLLAAGGIAHAWAIYRNVRAQEEERAEERFDEYLTDRAFAVEHKVRELIESLHWVRAFFEASTDVTKEEFTTFTRRTLERNPSVQALEWLHRVPAAEREAHEAGACNGGHARYRITEADPGGRMVPAGLRDVYYPVCYVEPLEGNECAHGFDVASEPRRRAALERALRTNEPSLSDPITLVQDEGASGSPGVLAFLPIRSPEVADDTIDVGLRGVALVVCRIEDVLRGAGLIGSSVPASMAFRLDDPEVSGRTVRLFEQAEGATVFGEHVDRRRIHIGGQAWVLSAIPAGPLAEEITTSKAIWPAVAVLLAWVVLGGLPIHLGRRLRRRMLQRQSRLFSSVLHGVSEGVTVADTKGRILFSNEAATQLVGLEDAGASPEEWASTYGCFLPDRTTPFPDEDLPLARAIRGESVARECIFIRNAARPDGVWISASGTPLRDEMGRCIGGVAVLVDTTHQRESQQTAQHLARVVEQTADAVLISDQEGKILYVNPAVESITGYSREELLGSTPAILNSGIHSDAFYDDMWKTIMDGDVWRGLVTNRRKSGEIYYSEQTITPMASETEGETFFVSVAKDMTEARLLRERDVEIRVAEKVQQRLYPQATPSIEGLDLAGSVHSAAATCGDYYDYIPMPDGSLGIVIGDVSGHGLGPALIMAQTRAYLRSCVQVESSPGEVLRRINTALVGDLEDHYFVTLFLAFVDVPNRKLRYASAGHVPGHVLTGTGEITELGPTGPVLGVLPDSDFKTRDLTIEPGDLVVLFTDGVTECRAPDGAFFDEEGALEVLQKHIHDPAERILEEVHEAIDEFAGQAEHTDDVTMVAFRITGASG